MTVVLLPGELGSQVLLLFLKEELGEFSDIPVDPRPMRP